MKRSVDDNHSRYVWGGETTTFPTRLGWWERRIMERADDDRPITITAEYNQRPDLLAFDLYGKDSLGPMILQYNNIIDHVLEFVTGRDIIVPSPARVTLDILNQQTGGVREQQ